MDCFRRMADMWRTLITLVLIGTTLTGPAFCCCSFAAFTRSSGSVAASAADCCCSTGLGTSPCHSGEDRSGHQCPCKQQRLTAATLGNDQVALLIHTLDRCEFAPTVDPNSAVITASMHAEFRTPCHHSCAFPHLDGAGILRAKQVNQC